MATRRDEERQRKRDCLLADPRNHDVKELGISKRVWDVLWGLACDEHFYGQGGFMKIGPIIDLPIEKVLREAHMAADGWKSDSRHRLTLRQFIELQRALADLCLFPWGPVREDTTPPSPLQKAKAEIDRLKAELAKKG